MRIARYVTEGWPIRRDQINLIGHTEKSYQ